MRNEYLSSSAGQASPVAWFKRLYRRFFGKPALSPRKGEVYFKVYKLASERLMEAERAVEDARSAFYRSDHPFSYQISESATPVGGQDR